MRAILGKELRELTPLLWLQTGVAVALAIAMWKEREPPDAIVVIGAVGGAMVGVTQAILDRVHQGGSFLRHRPMSPLRLELVRALAGAVMAVAPVLLFVDILAVLPYRGWRAGYQGITMGVATLTVLGSLAMWSGVRCGATARGRILPVILAAVVPLSLLFAVSHAPTLAWAITGTAAATVLFTGCAVLARTEPSLSLLGRRIKAACVLGVILLVVFEAGAWIRLGWHDVHYVEFGTGMHVGMTADGKVFREIRGGSPRYQGPVGQLTTTADYVFEAHASRIDDHSQLFRVWDRGRAPPYLLPPPMPSAGGNAIARRLSQVLVFAPNAPQGDWSYESGRLVFRDASGAVVAGIGPEGYAPGPGAARGETFSAPVLEQISEAGWGRYLEELNEVGGRLGYRLRRLVVIDGREVVTVTFSVDPSNPYDPEAIEDDALRRALAPHARVVFPDPVVPVALPVHPHVAVEEFRPILVRTGGELVALGPDGRRLGSTPYTEGEIVHLLDLPRIDDGPHAWSAALVTLLLPFDAFEPHFRLRLFREDGTASSADMQVEPASLQENVCLFLARLPSLLQPPAANAFAALDAPPRTIDGFYLRWWGDPALAGGRRSPWLVASLLLGLLCGLEAWRYLRFRDAPPVRAWVAAVALLGLPGIVWMRAMLPPVHVEACACGRRRAVTVPACPKCGEEWPPPEPTGVEILIEG